MPLPLPPLWDTQKIEFKSFKRDRVREKKEKSVFTANSHWTNRKLALEKGY